MKRHKLSKNSVGTAANITIRVVPKSSECRLVEQMANGDYKIKLTAPADDNKANIQLCEKLAVWLQIPKSSITIKTGKTSRVKVVSIELAANVIGTRISEILNNFPLGKPGYC